MAPKPRGMAARFWEKVQKTTGCWGWTGATADFGYGVMQRGGRGHGLVKAHRASWEIHFGEVPFGMRVLHTCDNPPCTNPAHLWLGTTADNQRDMATKGRGRDARSTHCQRGHPRLRKGRCWECIKLSKLRYILRKRGTLT